MKLLVATVTVCVLAMALQSTAQRSESNCNVGSACDTCPEGHYKVLRVGTRDLKVCCAGCSKYFRAGYRQSDNRPFCVCDNPDSITGDCWKGQQCETCLAGPNSGYVGRINSIPICCANCERSGMAIGPRLCNCLHNGP